MRANAVQSAAYSGALPFQKSDAAEVHDASAATACRAAMPAGNAVTLHLEVEPFETACEPELTACAMHVAGVCDNPGCSVVFAPSTPWQKYCCSACRRCAVNEARAVGHKIAPALLAWRQYKRAKPGTPEADLCRAARRYITQVQTAWAADRSRRRAAAGGGA